MFIIFIIIKLKTVVLLPAFLLCKSWYIFYSLMESRKICI